jgi:predicted DNA-binding transcriptional regulator YafY
MAEERAKFGRVVWVDQQIKSGRKPSAKELAEEYETSARTIKRDIQYLRDRYGAPIEWDAAANGYYYSEPTWELGAVPLTEHELFSITIAADVLDAYRNSPLHEDLSRIFDKLTAHLPEKVSVTHSMIGERFSVFHLATSCIEPGIWELVLQALRECRVLRFHYTAAGYTTSVSKACEPYHCIGYKGEWYLVARDIEKAALRIFALSRMETVTLSDTTFTVPAGFTVNDYVDPAFGIHLNDHPEEVRIRFMPHLAGYIRERQWHRTQKITERAEGSLELTFTTNQLNAIRFWVQSWGPGAVVLAPAQLREQVKSDLQESMEFYQSEE